MQKLEQNEWTEGKNSSVGAMNKAKLDFIGNGFVLITDFIPLSIRKSIAKEVLELADRSSVRRDLTLAETSHSHRKMNNVDADLIDDHDGAIATIYRSPQMLGLLSEIADEPVFECPYDFEKYVITRLTNSGDTHGWHWDDYSLAVVVVAETPPVTDGGFVQTVYPTSWDKDNPRVYEKIVENPVRSFGLKQYDAYLLRSDLALHQVHPIRGGQRTIVNMTFVTNRDKDKVISHETMEKLFSQNGHSEK